MVGHKHARAGHVHRHAVRVCPRRDGAQHPPTWAREDGHPACVVIVDEGATRLRINRHARKRAHRHGADDRSGVGVTPGYQAGQHHQQQSGAEPAR